MKKILALMFVLSILIPFSVFAHSEETFTQAEHIIEEKIPCENLTEDQLEIIGDYYMEQMHPGEAHEEMDEMMGGEGSESLRLMHIRMAESFYCGEHEEVSGGMMNMMMGRNSMMGDSIQPCTEESCPLNTNGGNTMMGSYGMEAWWLLYVILGSAIFGLAFWGTYKLMIKNKR